MKKMNLFMLVGALALATFGLTMDKALKRMPEIVKEPELLIDIVYDLDATNRVPFINKVNAAIDKYPAAPDEKKKLKQQVEFYAFCSTNNKPQTVLNVPWVKQLEFQHAFRMRNTSSSSYWEVQHIPIFVDGSSVITQPFDYIVVPRGTIQGRRGDENPYKQPKQRGCPCKPYKGQSLNPFGD